MISTIDNHNNLHGRGRKILFWNRLKKAGSSSHGQLVAHNKNVFSAAPSI